MISSLILNVIERSVIEMIPSSLQLFDVECDLGSIKDVLFNVMIQNIKNKFFFAMIISCIKIIRK